MKKQNYLKLLVLLFVPALLLTSCNKDDDELTVYANAVFVKKEIDGSAKVGLNYYVTANKGLKSVSVKTPNYSTVTLSKSSSSNYIFLKEAADSEYSIYPTPGTGYYTFTVISEGGDSLTIKDHQKTFTNISIANIDSIGYSSSKGLYIDWDSIAGANSYQVQLLDSADETSYVFTGVEQKVSYSYSYLLPGNSNWGTWNSSPQSGKPYRLKIYGRVYDADATVALDLQELSIKDTVITWP